MTRALYLAAGCACVALAILGIALPILPTVPFLLLATFCFARSRPELAQRLYDHPRYGPALRQWRDRRAIGRGAKLSAVAAMALGAGVSWLTIGRPWALAVCGVLVCTASWIWTRPE